MRPQEYEFRIMLPLILVIHVTSFPECPVFLRAQNDYMTWYMADEGKAPSDLRRIVGPSADA